MVAAASAAESALTKRARQATPARERARPAMSASEDAMRPAGSGRWRVRFINPSCSLSHHWLRAAAPAALNAVPARVAPRRSQSHASRTPKANPAMAVARVSRLRRALTNSAKSEAAAAARGRV